MIPQDGTLSPEAAAQLVAMLEDESIEAHTGEDLPQADREALLAKAKQPCPSCGGSGWCVFLAERIVVAQGACRCVGGKCWRNP